MSVQKYPKITLVTVCYNHAKYVAETIESVLSQQYPNLEYIVIDDGSTDNSWDIIQKYKEKLTLCEHLDGYRDTPTTALSYGLNKGAGEIMGWLNSDDILLPGSLFRVAQIFTDNKDVRWFTGVANTINSDSQLVGTQMYLKNKYDFLIGDWRIIQQESTFWCRSLWKEAGNMLCEAWAFDTELWTRFFMLTDHYHARVSIGAFRKGMQSKSVSDQHLFLNPNKKCLRKMRKHTSLEDRMLSVIYWICKKILWPLLSIIPTRFYRFIPVLKIFVYKTIEYSFIEKKWVTGSCHPFRGH
ncbi:MAG TPA: glycosyltransferase [Candidatus Magasanikbacteria bacterium]|nr:MAG: hypothetical protein A2479_03355 [Candidatus Magasanikbacteria bacterium RIFOXYC2_FULL_39_8]HAT03320.1 glycosyltransferase [Candidatus Magasanikbacteria bacterium]